MSKDKGGKYAAVLPGLPKFVEESSYQEKVNQVKQTITNRDAVALAQEYVEVREVKASLEEDLYLANMKIAALEQLLDDSQERQAAGWGDYGVKDNALRLPSGATIRVHREPYGQVKDKEAFRLWCIANGYERQLQLWPATMNALVKERLLVGEAEPDGCEAFAKTKVVLVKGDQ
jgi:hypothetical protein